MLFPPPKATGTKMKAFLTILALGIPSTAIAFFLPLPPRVRTATTTSTTTTTTATYKKRPDIRFAFTEEGSLEERSSEKQKSLQDNPNLKSKPTQAPQVIIVVVLALVVNVGFHFSMENWRSG